MRFFREMHILKIHSLLQEFSNGVMFRFTLPEFGSSPLGKVKAYFWFMLSITFYFYYLTVLFAIICLIKFIIHLYFKLLITVKRCVEVLKCILQKDCALLTLIKWYTIRNAPGAQDISPKQEWRLFTSAILSIKIDFT